MKKLRSIIWLLILVLMLAACAPKEEEALDNQGGYEYAGGQSQGEEVPGEETPDAQEPQDTTPSPETDTPDPSTPEPETEEQEDEQDTPDTPVADPDTPVENKPSKDATVVDIETDLRWFGRTYAVNGTHYFNWTESGFEFTFNGTGAEATFESNAPGGKHTAYIKIYVDKQAGKSVAIGDSMQTVTLCEGLKKGSHTVRVVKRTNGRSSSVGLMDITLLKNGAIGTPPAAKERRIEFVGDSLTVGYGTLAGSGDSEWSTATEDGSVTYAALCAQALDAEYNVVAISGRGLAHNTGGDAKQLMPHLYPLIDDYNRAGVPWDFSCFVPDVIVVNLGANDRSTSTPSEIEKAMTEFLKSIRKNNPNAYIIAVHGMVSMSAEVENALKNAVAKVGDNKISHFKLPLATDKALGHPAKSAHKESAAALEAEIRRITGWK